MIVKNENSNPDRKLAKHRHITHNPGSECKGVGVEKLGFRSERPNFWGWKMSCDPRGSLIRHPDAILFSRFLQK